ncbi:MAG: FkbM family methyltransferase, partial [Candidatus Methylumidiphilus sp.]
MLVSIPRGPKIATICGKVRFEHAPLPFLDEGDLRAMLTDSYDIILCDYLRRHLAPGNIVLDVGANVGYISATAASCVGESGEVHGFEPLPVCYTRLQRLQELNPNIRFKFNNVALGESEGLLPIAYNPQGDSRNATLVPGKQFAET